MQTQLGTIKFTLVYCSFFMFWGRLPSPLCNPESDVSSSYCMLLFLDTGQEQFLSSLPCPELSFPAASSCTLYHIHVLSKIPSPDVPLLASLTLTQHRLYWRMAGSLLSCHHIFWCAGNLGIYSWIPAILKSFLDSWRWGCKDCPEQGMLDWPHGALCTIWGKEALCNIT